DGGILVVPSVADSPLKLNAMKGFCSDFHDRTFALSSIVSMSGCCQVTIPLGYHDDHCISVSFISAHGGDKFLLDTVLDMYTTLQEQASSGFDSLPLPSINGNMEPSEVSKEKEGNEIEDFGGKEGENRSGKDDSLSYTVGMSKIHFLLPGLLSWISDCLLPHSLASLDVCTSGRFGSKFASFSNSSEGNAAFKEKQWDKAITHYTDAIELNGTNATYYCNRAAALLKLGCFQLAEEDCSKAILHDKKNVKAYLRRGTARVSLLRYKEALEDFKHALVLEPQNKDATRAEQRVRKLMS
ncbi:amidase 1-like protein, partial [Trifolium pratense]